MRKKLGLQAFKFGFKFPVEIAFQLYSFHFIIYLYKVPIVSFLFRTRSRWCLNCKQELHKQEFSYSKADRISKT
jgi:hypothetical protein